MPTLDPVTADLPGMACLSYGRAFVRYAEPALLVTVLKNDFTPIVGRVVSVQVQIGAGAPVTITGVTNGRGDVSFNVPPSMAGDALVGITVDGIEVYLLLIGAIPALTVTGSPDITYFDRAGVNYTQVLWRAPGTASASAAIPGVRAAAVGGGASGGNSGQAPGGGGAGDVQEWTGALSAGTVAVTIGSGGAGLAAGAAGNGAPGNASSLIGAGLALTAPGGGYGGANGNGGPGGCGGGAGVNSSTSRTGGVGTKSNGGDSFGAVTATERAGGGGGGAGGAGGAGVLLLGGDGGVGVTLAWADPPLSVAGGGAGISNTGVSGAASHGGTLGSKTAPTDNATDGGGSGGGSSSVGTGDGGDGLAVIVFPTANAIIITG